MKKFYRYEAKEYAVKDWDGEYVATDYPNPKIELREFELLRETPKGYWIYPDYAIGGTHKEMFKRWVPKESKKRYAYPTKDEALTSFIKRMELRIKFLSRDLHFCKSALNKAKHINVQPENNKSEEVF